jgi:formate dehydrogenase gamma subunit
LLAITNRLAGVGILGLLVLLPSPAMGADPENCLSCHRYRGLARINDDGGTVRLFYVDPTYYDHFLGPHAAVPCTGCHPRNEVEVIPHKPVSRVNCTTACHLSAPERLEIRFGHDAIAGMLESSVHKPEVLTQSNLLLGDPLAAGQSQCLLCHDEPTFRWANETWAEQQASVGRCNVCHDQQLPVNTRYFFWHVHARSRPARSHHDLTRACAMCHSNPQIKQHFEMPDATASYLASFHGKGMQLGSQSTASCLDCHVSQLQNIHLMQSHEQAGAPTSPEQLPITCRSAACHPTSGYRVSTAAVHLDLSAGHSIEFFIALLFVVLILFTFGPSVLLQSLELLQIVVGRHDPAHHDRRHLADELQKLPQGRQALTRFTPHQRVQHWILFLCFTLLVVTGFPIKFADRAWAANVVNFVGGLSLARSVHRIAGFTLIAGFTYHFLYVALFTWKQKRRKSQGLIRTILELPMVMGWHDVKQLFHLLGYLFFLRRTRPEAGRFSLKEKFEYFGVFWGCSLLGVTGVLMWANAWTTEYLTGRVLTAASLVHTFEAFLALLHVGVIHMIGVIFSPTVFPLSPAMFTGRTPSDELAEAHAALVVEAEQQAKSEPAGEVRHG